MTTRELYTLSFLVLITIAGFSQTRSTKRGLAYGHNSASDLAALSPGVSWWYNWGTGAEIGNYSDYNIDYVPMAWNAAFNKTAMHDFISTHPTVKYILGWNEPNFTTQGNLSPKQAAAHWPDIEALATEFDLKIVSPALNYCDKCVQEDGVTYSDPVQYLDAFFDECKDCKVDYIAIHTYMSNVSALQWYVGLFKKYGKPIWVTEFCSWEGTVTLNSQESYMIGALDYLENDPDVFRYAWFTGRQDVQGSPYMDILGQSGKLTELGSIFVNTPPHDSLYFKIIPAILEAESYSKMNGILLEKTSDVSGVANVGYIDAGDWMEYNVNSLAKDTFNISFRVANNISGNVSIYIDGTLKETVSLPASGGWQNWTTIKAVNQLVLEGKHKIRLKTNTGGFNINWFELKKNVPKVVTGTDNEMETGMILVHPNPVKNKLIIDPSIKLDWITIYDLQGKTINLGISTDNVIDFSSYEAGLYLVKAGSKKRVYTQKIVKE